MNKKIAILLLYPLLAGAWLSAQSTEGEQQAEVEAAFDPLKQSQEAAENWLKLLDEAEYDKSWEEGSLTLKLTVPKKHWIALMERIRKPLGSVIFRQKVEQRPAQNPKGLPRGDYMVILFRSSFSKKEAVNELVTLVLESDGEWKVLTYQVQ